MSRRLPSRPTVALLLLTLILAAGAGRDTGRAPPRRESSGPSYLFISPNTEENLSLAEASQRLESPAHRQYRLLVGDVLRELGLPGIIAHDAVGDWSDGVENSLFVVLPRADDDVLRCAAAWFGLLARQKSVLAFHADPDGPDVLAVLDLPRHDLAATRRLLDRNAIAARTILARGRGCRVIVVDVASRSAPALQAAAISAGGRLSRQPGRAESLSGSTRYAEIIRTSRCRPLARLP
jgi:hypothetical protein